MLGFGMMRFGTESAKGIRGDWDKPIMMSANYPIVWIHMVLAIITWLAVLAVLLSIARWFWLNGNREKK